MSSLSLPDLSRSLAELQARPNLFAHTENGHATALRYAFDALTSPATRETSMGRFGAAIWSRALPSLDAPPAPGNLTIQPGSTLDRVPPPAPDFVVRVHRNGTAHHAVLDTATTTSLSPERAAAYRTALQKQTGTSTPPPLIRYAPVPPLGPTADAVHLLGPDAIRDDLEAACQEGQPSWPVDEYRDWLTFLRRRDTLYRQPSYQTWYLGGSPDQLPSTEAWPAPPTGQRRVYAYILRRLARTTDDLRTDTPIVPDRRPGAVDLPLASVVANGDTGTLCVRLRSDRTDTPTLDLRFRAGPPRSAPQDEKADWIDRKKALRSTLEDQLAAHGLGEHIDLPGSRAYPFQKSAHDTSLCRVWLPGSNSETPPSSAVDPQALPDLFPRLYTAAAAAVRETSALEIGHSDPA